MKLERIEKGRVIKVNGNKEGEGKGNETEIKESKNTNIIDIDYFLSIQNEFEKLKSFLKPDEDIMKITNKDYITKLGYNKIATSMRISLEVKDIQRYESVNNDKVKVVYVVVLKAILPDGRYVEGVGACSSDELGKINKPEYSLLSHAYTRAFNRAISFLVGGSHISYEEIEGFEDDIVKTSEVEKEEKENRKEETKKEHYEDTSKEEKEKNKLIYLILDYVEKETAKGKSKDEVFSLFSNLIKKRVNFLKDLSVQELRELTEKLGLNDRKEKSQKKDEKEDTYFLF